jgi:hypothetical protein
MNAGAPTGISTRRRLVLQLTPLLDLLFIVLFAQYIDLQEATRRDVSRETQRRQQAEQAQDDAAKLRTDALTHVSELTQKIEQFEIEKRRLTRELELARAETQKEGQAREELEKLAAKDRAAIGSLVQNVLRINQDAILEALQGAPTPDRQRLRASFEEMTSKSAAAVIHHLRATEELKKRADLWEVYIADDNSVRVTLVGEVMAEHLQVQTADQLANTIAEVARQRGEPKSLVIVLLSWSNADRRTRDLARQALEDVVTVLKADWPGKRIEVAPLGYTPVPP